MPYTWADFDLDYIKEHFPELTPEKRREVLESLPPEDRRQMLESLPPEKQREVLQLLPLQTRLAGVSAEEIQRYLEQLTAHRPAPSRKPRRKK